MIKCPKCGSTAQLEIFETEYKEDGAKIEVIRYYRCGCGHGFTTSSLYEWDGFEIIDDECI